PILRYPSGEVEVMGALPNVPNGGFNPTAIQTHNSALFFTGQNSGTVLSQTWFTLLRLTANGRQTTYNYTSDKGWRASIVDPPRRVTSFERDSVGHVTRITVPAPGGSSRDYVLTWSPQTFTPAALLPDVCDPFNPRNRFTLGNPLPNMTIDCSPQAF